MNYSMCILGTSSKPKPIDVINKLEIRINVEYSFLFKPVNEVICSKLQAHKLQLRQ